MLISKTISSVGRLNWSYLSQLRSSLLRNGSLTNFSTDPNPSGKEDENKAEEIPAAQKQLEEDVKELNETVAELTGKYQRSLAENENVRKRLRKEISDAKLFGIQSFCKDLLDVADVLKMALNSIPEEKSINETDPTWKDFYTGVTLTDKELHKVFERHGLQILNPEKGEKFNPHEHEALFEAPIEGIAPGSIALIQRAGYKLKGRTIRPAQVGVTPKAK